MHRSTIWRRKKRSIPLEHVPEDNYDGVVSHKRRSNNLEHPSSTLGASSDRTSSLNLLPSNDDYLHADDIDVDLEPEVEIDDSTRYQSGQDSLIEKLIRIHMQHRISFQGMDSVIELLNEVCSRKVASGMRNELRKYQASLFSYSYRFVCTCGSTIKAIKIDGKLPSSITCANCRSILDRNCFFKTKFFIDLSIQEQLEWICKKVHSKLPTDTTILDLVAAIDGIPLSNSSTLSLLPILLYVQNLDTKTRSCLPILKTIYVDSSKPDVDHFLDEFINEVNFLIINDFPTQLNQKTRIRLVGLLADAPCRAWLLNLSQFNGEYPCHRCLIRADTSENSPKFPPINIDEIKERTVNDTENIREMIRTRFNLTNIMIRGVKSAGTPLNRIIQFDYIKQTLCEYQHSNPLGLIRFMLRDVFFNQLYVNQCYYIGDKIAAIDENISRINIISSFRRKPRTLATIKHWKANELENFLFYIAPEALKGILPDPFYSHIIAYAACLHKLLDSNSNISDPELKRDINVFIKSTSILGYPNAIFRYNFHLIVHLFEDYKRFGPLSDVTAYTYESQLGKFKTSLKNLYGIAQQIATNNKLKILSFRSEDSDSINQPIGVGKARSIPSNIDEQTVLDEYGSRSDIIFYDKAKVNGHMIASYKHRKTSDTLVRVSNYVLKIKAIFRADNTLYVGGNTSKLLNNLEVSILNDLPTVKVDYMYHFDEFHNDIVIYRADKIKSSMILLVKANVVSRFFTKNT